MGFSLIILLVSTLAVVKSTPNMFVSVSGDIKYDGTDPKVEVHLNGMDQSIITDQERSKFQIYDSRLKDCVGSYYGKRPDDVYVRSPTPWGDLYQSYGWRQIYRIVKPLKATILNISKKQDLVSQKLYKNDRDTPATGKATLSRTFENKIATTWSEGNDFTVGGEVSISASLKVIDVGASTSISNTKSWGKAVEHSQATAITDGAELEFEVPPHGSVFIKTEMYQTKVTVKVEYEATLEGDTAVNYSKPYKGHHFYAMDINQVMRSCGLPINLFVTEDITLDLVTGAQMEIADAPSSFAPSSDGGKSVEIEVIEL